MFFPDALFREEGVSTGDKESMDHLANALVASLLAICARGDEASGIALKNIVRELRQLTDQEAAVLRSALITIAEDFDPFDPDLMFVELLEESIFGDEDSPYWL